MTNLRKFGCFTALGFCFLPTAHAQNAPLSRAECFSLHEKAQSQRLESKLLVTRSTLRQCSGSSCPSLVAADCVRWLEEVEHTIPTVVFEAAADDKDVANVKITEGDRVIAETITGTPIEFDPGVHKFKAVTPGKPPQEGTYILREGEKSRVIRLAWNSNPTGRPGEPTGPRPIPPTTYIFGSAAIAAAGTGAVLGFLALKKKSDLDALHCKPLCTDAQVKPIKSMALYADIGFGVAVASAGLATLFYFTRPIVPKDSDEKPPPGGIKPEAFITPTFAGLGMEGSF